MLRGSFCLDDYIARFNSTPEQREFLIEQHSHRGRTHRVGDIVIDFAAPHEEEDLMPVTRVLVGSMAAEAREAMY